MTFDDILKNYRENSSSTHEKGSRFEILMKNFLLTYPPYRGKFSKIFLWNEFSDEPDLGIDLVAETFDGEFWAVQCKFYAESSTINKSAVDSFISNSSRTFHGKNFSQRIWISTSDNFTDNALKNPANFFMQDNFFIQISKYILYIKFQAAYL